MLRGFIFMVLPSGIFISQSAVRRRCPSRPWPPGRWSCVAAAAHRVVPLAVEVLLAVVVAHHADAVVGLAEHLALPGRVEVAAAEDHACSRSRPLVSSSLPMGQARARRRPTSPSILASIWCCSPGSASLSMKLHHGLLLRFHVGGFGSSAEGRCRPRSRSVAAAIAMQLIQRCEWSWFYSSGTRVMTSIWRAAARSTRGMSASTSARAQCARTSAARTSASSMS